MTVIKDEGVDAAIAAYHRLRTTEPNAYDFAEGELNGLGYALLGMGNVAGAIRVFEFEREPASAIVERVRQPGRRLRPGEQA